MIAAQSTPARKRFTFLMLIATCCMWTGDLRAQEASEVQEPRKEQSVTPGTEPQHTNRLVDSTSPYLLQHAHNPVDWYEWSEEAFDKAVREDKPVFLSIGYAACHWCHVMEHESFENEQVADYLNEHFVSIKVDREERPDIDEIYMQYTVQSTGRGGWPMSVWLMPDKSPFVAGTYFPREHFLEVLRRINNVWESDRGQITNGARQAANALNKWATGPEPAEDVIPQRTVARTAHLLKDHFDMKRGGLSSGGNKFPPSMAMDLMLRQYRHEESAALWEAVDITLDHMARGGIYDHLGGGICRYSTDPDWLVPHFEKMLYDQAMVSAIYLDGYQVSGKQAYADVAADIFQYVLTDLRSPEGGFYSSRDADSEGMEGKFYIWTVEQIIEVLGEEDGRLCCKYFDVTESGNWFENRGHAPAGPKNILRITQAPEQFARANDLKPNEFKQRLADWKKKLLAAREQRVPPGLDDKVLTAWNGLMIASLAKAGRVLDEPKYTQAAARAADFVLTNLHRDGRLLRTYRNGKARYTGYLDDYAFFISGLLYLYEADGDPKWLNTATTLADATIKYFADDQNGGFFFTADDGEELVTRSKSPHDNAIPSGNSVMAMNLLRLGLLTGEKAYRAQAESVFRAFQPQVARNPAAFERLLCAVDFYHDEVREIAILGDPADRGTERLLRTVYREYLPNKVVALSAGDAVDSPFPLLRGKTIRNSAPTAYVCENYRCQAPVNDHNELAGLLGFKAEPTPSTAEQ